MKQKEIHETLSAAIAKWGADSQLDMVVEEAAELIQAINKLKRKVSTNTIEDLCSKIVDVEIMLAQLKIILDKDNTIEYIREQKLMRLKNRLAQ